LEKEWTARGLGNGARSTPVFTTDLCSLTLTKILRSVDSCSTLHASATLVMIGYTYRVDIFM